MKLKKFKFTLTRTRLQSATVVIEARNAHDAEVRLVEDVLDQGNEYDDLDWSDGENEGAIDIDYDEDTDETL